jgi:hypothetical protein
MGHRIHDEAGLFSATDLQRLEGTSLPFELHVLTTNASSSRGALETRVHHEVDGPNVVAIGVDPSHHWAVVHFGNGTGVSPSSWSTVLDAGKQDFHDAKWTDGVLKSAGKASQMRTSSTVVINQHPAQSHDNTGAWIFGGVVLAVIAAVGYLWWRARRKEREFQERAASIRSSPYRTAGSAPAYEPDVAPVRARAASSPAAPSTVVVNQGGGSSDLLTGYIIGSATHQPSSGSSSSSSSSSYSSSSSSSWDSGSSSSYDSGGSFGGGFDSGGGGCDF